MDEVELSMKSLQLINFISDFSEVLRVKIHEKLYVSCQRYCSIVPTW